MQERFQQLQQWLNDVVGLSGYHIEPASEDASFRRYFRVQTGDESFVVMDSPPDKEPCATYIDIAQRLLQAGVNAPQIYQRDEQQGFLLITDLGDQLYLSVLNEQNADRLYKDAIFSLIKLQKYGVVDGLPEYGVDLLSREMNLFRDWLLSKHIELELSSAESTSLDETFQFLQGTALEQPRVFVHRDYHSRNLLYLDTNNPGVVDFQDAVFGPITYDLVSLLKDCYVKWSRQQITAWARHFYNESEKLNTMIDFAGFLRWFDLMGVQRHLKASGIFCRLFYRDHKPGFLQDIPRTLSYITDLKDEYPELSGLCHLIESGVYPSLDRARRRCGL